jgi:hypothetical protein
MLPSFQFSKTFLGFVLLATTFINFACSSPPPRRTDSPDGSVASMTAVGLKEKDVVDAYVYLMARYFVIRQEHIDTKEENLGYNRIKYNPLGQASFVNPNLDVAYLETWLAVDEKSCQVLEVPKIQNRYYTVQVLDEWAGVITNINERNYPNHPYGRFAFCLQGNRSNTPLDSYRIALPSRKAKILARIERKGNDAEVLRLQQEFKLIADTNTKIEPAVEIPMFTNAELPLSDAFLRPMVDQVMNSAPDNMAEQRDQQNKVKAVAYYISQSSENKQKIENILREKALPDFKKYVASFGLHRGGWSTTSQYTDGFDRDYWFRTATTYGGIWWNVSREVTYFLSQSDSKNVPLTGDNTYLIHFKKEALPQNQVKAFWSLTLLGVPEYKTIPNSLNRYKLSSTSQLTYERDGSLILAVGARPKSRVPESNWIPGPSDGRNFSLNLRMYAPKDAVLRNKWFAPTVMKEETLEIQKTSLR